MDWPVIGCREQSPLTVARGCIDGHLQHVFRGVRCGIKDTSGHCGDLRHSSIRNKVPSRPYADRDGHEDTDNNRPERDNDQSSARCVNIPNDPSDKCQVYRLS